MELAKSVYLLSLGCAKNFVDSEVMLGVLARAGYAFTTNAADADIIVINTCAFIDSAVAEATEAIHELARYKQHGSCSRLVVCGCLPQRFKEHLAEQFPEVDLWLGTGAFQRIDRYLAQHGSSCHRIHCDRPTYLMHDRTPRVLATPPGSAYIKIAEGCSNACTYCTIPSIRGPYRTRPQQSIIREASRLVRQHGVKEINLIAQDTSRYPGLSQLLKKLARIPGLCWIRLLYAHPAHLDTDILRLMADEDVICNYLDLPLQHIADRMLRRMGRATNACAIRLLLDRARHLVPDISLRTTFMVGFPGETDRDFRELVSFVREAQFDHLGVFAYRDEPGTPASRMTPKVPAHVVRERVRELMHEQASISRKNNRRHRGKIYEVLVEGPAARSGFVMQGRTVFQAPEVDGVVLISDTVAVGDMLPVHITKTLTHDLVGCRILD
ncbi:MAG: 30S ribosomal protein S12 methylthiotransferase RimO [Desulfobacterota bacterium]|nr:30S ribosomal protein S12 methylthiotransferase RimO [Thermodesulfobacteriota bacterium]